MSQQNETPTTPHSYHIFIFPFRWTHKSSDKEFDIKDFLNDGWQKVRTSNSIAHYNERSYFYPFVHPAIFGEEKNKSCVQHFDYRLNCASSYYISIEKKDKSKDNEYHLQLERLQLSTYNNGVATLAFFCRNDKYPEIQDILNINDFGRRLYPQFLVHEEGHHILKTTRDKFLAKQIEIKINDKFFNLLDDEFVYESTKKFPKISNVITNLICNRYQPSNDDLSNKNPMLTITPILDDRMFVLCHYRSNPLSHCLSGKPAHNPKSIGNWMQLMFVDNNGNTCQSPEMQQQLLKNHTYDRWKNYGTLYGITRYSLVCVTDEGGFASKITEDFKSMYYQMVQLALVQRASILYFSEEITKIVDSDSEQIASLSKGLYQNYLSFINKVYFREITAQEQGIEMYDMLHRAMRMESHAKSLNDEIQGLHDFVALQSQIKQADKANKLAVLAAWFLPAGVIFGILGVSFLPGTDAKISDTFFNGQPHYASIVGIAIGLILSVILSYLIHHIYINNKNYEK